MKELTILLVLALPFITLFFGITAKERNKMTGWSVVTSLLVGVVAALVAATHKDAHWASYILLAGLGLGGFISGLLFTEVKTLSK